MQYSVVIGAICQIYYFSCCIGSVSGYVNNKCKQTLVHFLCICTKINNNVDIVFGATQLKLNSD